MIDGGRFLAKAIVGQPLEVEADVFAHGHDVVRAKLRHRPAGTRRFKEAPMVSLGNDRFAAAVVPDTLGELEIEVAGAVDHLATALRDARRRLAAKRLDAFDGQVIDRYGLHWVIGFEADA